MVIKSFCHFCCLATTFKVLLSEKKKNFYRSQVIFRMFFLSWMQSLCAHVTSSSSSLRPPTALVARDEAAACGSWYQGCVEVGGAASQPPATL